MTSFTQEDVVRVAAGLSKRPRMTLIAWPRGQWEWMKATEALEAQGEHRVSYRHTIRPLETRGLAALAFGGFYNPATGAWKPKRWKLTPLGLAVRNHLKETSK